MAAPDLITRKTSLSANIVSFCRFLRSRGYAIGPAEEADALLALEKLAPFNNAQLFQMCLGATLSRSYAQQLQFPKLFEAYWKELDRAVDSKIVDDDPEKMSEQKKAGQKAIVPTIKEWLKGSQSSESTGMATYSGTEVFARKDFTAFGPEEIPELVRIIHMIARTMAKKVSRRNERSPSAHTLNLRRTLRLNLRRGGEMIDLVHQRPRRLKQNIVLLCDVSRSMDLYSRFLIQFLYAFQNAFHRIETFVFSTQLYRITKELKHREFQIALDQIAEQVPGWSGGTQIGTSLQQFSDRYAAKMINRHTTVIIMSDGWDTGDTAPLERAMGKVHRRAQKVIWLNPLAGSPEFEPTAKGMQAAMPFIDIFASVHNIESLRMIARYLR